MKRLLSNLITGLLVMCALAVTALVVRRELFTPNPARPRRISGWPQLARSGHVIGPASAKVRIVEFSDFQCPFCGAIQPTLRRLLAEYPGEVAIVFKQLPLQAHPWAFEAAGASECAAQQGAFAAYHDALFGNQAAISGSSWDTTAVRAHVPDLAAFDRCMKGKTYRLSVERDVATAKELGLTGTPTFIVDGMALLGPSAEELESRVKSAVKRSREGGS